MSQKSGRPSKQETSERREKVRELLLKGKSKNAIATIVGANRNTIDNDIRHVQARYTKMVVNNPHLAEKQFARVERLLSEVEMIKQEHWTIFEELQKRVKDGEERMAQWEKDLAEAKIVLEQAEAGEDKTELRKARQRYDLVARPPRIPTYINSRLDSLKAILDRVDKESKLLSLFNPQQLIEKNYVSIEVMKTVMDVFQGIITDLIPQDKRGYAFKRLKTIDIQALNGEDVVDAEVIGETPKPKTKKAKPAPVEEDEDVDLDSEI